MTLTVGYSNQELFHVVSYVAVFYSITTFLVVGRHIVSSIHMKAIFTADVSVEPQVAQARNMSIGVVA